MMIPTELRSTRRKSLGGGCVLLVLLWVMLKLFMMTEVSMMSVMM